MEKIYYGIADCHGIESFIKEDDDMDKHMNIMGIRASANKQRHAVLYAVRMTSEGARKIDNLLNKQEYINALKELKRIAGDNIAIPKGSSKNSWTKIPNPELDPYA